MNAFRRSVLLPAAGVLCLSGLVGGFAVWRHTQRPSPALPAHPVVTLEPAEVDFGTVLPGQSLTADVRVRNAGGSPLEVTELRTSCGCTPATIDRQTVPPGQDATISVRLQVPAHPGQVTHTAFFDANDPGRPGGVSVPIRAVAQWPVEASPATLRFSGVPVGTASAHQLEIYAPGTAPLRVTSMSPSVPWIDVKQTEASGRRVLYMVSVQPPSAGPFSERISVLTDSKDRPTIIVPVEGDTIDSVRVKPQAILLGGTSPSEVKSVNWVIESAHGPVNLTRVEAQNPDWKVLTWRQARTAGRHTLVSASIRVPAAAGHNRVTVNLYRSGEAKPAEVAVSCVVDTAQPKPR